MSKFVVVLALIRAAYAIPIDNGVLGDPEIECGPKSIWVTFNTENNFEGHVYVKGLYDQDRAGCRISGDGTRAVGAIEVPFDTCNVDRVRSANPFGIFVRTTMVITFHPNFITKVDRAYTLQCFYMERNKVVSAGNEVSMLTTVFQAENVPMPVCRYEILDDPNGNPIDFAFIGQPVFHKWTCDSETIETFCMFVYACFVVDPAGADRLNLIDEQGCATDRFLMGNIEYPSDLVGVKEVHVFKYADRAALYFQCQIRIQVKEPNAQCIRPQCGATSGRGNGARNKRNALPSPPRGDQRQADAAAIVDVLSSIETLDVDDRQAILPEELAFRAPASRHRYAPVPIQSEGMCVSMTTFAIVFTVSLLLIAAVVTVMLMKSGSNLHSFQNHDIFRSM